MALTPLRNNVTYFVSSKVMGIIIFYVSIFCETGICRYRESSQDLDFVEYKIKAPIRYGIGSVLKL